MMTTSLIVSIAWKSTAILCAAQAAAWAMRRASAATRHFLWTAAMASLLALPFAGVVKPIAVAAPVSPALRAVATVTVAPGGAFHNADFVPWIWWAGALAAAAIFSLGALRAHRLVRRAVSPPYPVSPATPRVRILESQEAPVPLAWGIWRPAVILPRQAREWPAGRLDTVLAHELAHIRRGDLAAQAVAHAACCLCWFQPLIWLALGRQRHERELACDSAVLRGGVLPHEYAGHLVELTRTLMVHRRPAVSAPAMAGSTNLEGRIRAVLDPNGNRRPLRPIHATLVAVALLAMLLPMTGLTLLAQSTSAAISGFVVDPSGARIPNCRVTARNLDGSNQEVTAADLAGEYRFGSIPPGHYTVEFAAPGFARLSLPATVAAGAPARVDAALNVGTVIETVKVTGQKPAAAPVAAREGGPPQRIRVGGNVQPLRLLHQTRPEYPAGLQAAGVEGTVLIRAVISTTGSVLNPVVINTDIDPRLAQAALAAVSQWQYQPSLLNGHAVEVLTTVSVEFKLE